MYNLCNQCRRRLIIKELLLPAAAAWQSKVPSNALMDALVAANVRMEACLVCSSTAINAMFL